ncbi:DUF432 domain-containing protein [Fibrobacterota bacterium]
MNSLLKDTSVPQGKCLRIEIGTLIVWIYNAETEWMAAYEYREEVAGGLFCQLLDEWPEDKDWQRRMTAADSDIIIFEPAMPDRPVVVRPEHPLHIPKGYVVQFFVGIPYNLRIFTSGEKKVKIFEKPTVTLSNIWFGEMETGELAYSLNSAVRSNWEALGDTPYKAICPVELYNRSDEDLEFKRASLQVKHLAVYGGKKNFWTNKINIKYVGGERFSDISITKDPPRFEDGLSKVCPPEEKLEANKVINTFRSLTHLPWF